MIDFSYFSQLFDQQKVDLDATEARWDRRAAEVSQFTVEDDDIALQTVVHHMSLNNVRVLEISFGGGRHLEKFLELGANISGVEISANMCAHATERLNRTGLPWEAEQLVQSSWEAIDLQARGWHEAFDLTFVNMSPALSSTAMLEKAVDATRRGLYIASHSHREDALLTTLQQELGLERRNPGQRYANDLYLTFNILYGWGYFPQMRFVQQDKTRRHAPEDIVERYASWLWNKPVASPADRQRLLARLQAKAEADGKIRCQSRDVIGHLWLDKTLRK